MIYGIAVGCHAISLLRCRRPTYALLRQRRARCFYASRHDVVYACQGCRIVGAKRRDRHVIPRSTFRRQQKYRRTARHMSLCFFFFFAASLIRLRAARQPCAAIYGVATCRNTKRMLGRRVGCLLRFFFFDADFRLMLPSPLITPRYYTPCDMLVYTCHQHTLRQRRYFDDGFRCAFSPLRRIAATYTALHCCCFIIAADAAILFHAICHDADADIYFASCVMSPPLPATPATPLICV